MAVIHLEALFLLMAAWGFKSAWTRGEYHLPGDQLFVHPPEQRLYVPSPMDYRPSLWLVKPSFQMVLNGQFHRDKIITACSKWESSVSHGISISTDGKEQLLWDFSSLPRDLYRGYCRINLSAPFRLFHCTINRTDSVKLYIPPELGEYRVNHPPGVSQAKASTCTRRVQRDDWTDQRKYYPGDDPRKIHWKQFARTGELHVRIDRQGIPLTKELFCLIHPFRERAALDYQLSSFRGMIRELYDNKWELKLRIPGEKKWLDYPQDEEELFKSLAALQGDEDPFKGSPPTGPVLLLTEPRDMTPWKSYLKDLPLWVENLSVPEKPRAALWKRILFREVL